MQIAGPTTFPLDLGQQLRQVLRCPVAQFYNSARDVLGIAGSGLLPASSEDRLRAGNDVISHGQPPR
jgi:hypothetical protein